MIASLSELLGAVPNEVFFNCRGDPSFNAISPSKSRASCPKCKSPIGTDRAKPRTGKRARHVERLPKPGYYYLPLVASRYRTRLSDGVFTY
jgi:hypothetical protein